MSNRLPEFHDSSFVCVDDAENEPCVNIAVVVPPIAIFLWSARHFEDVYELQDIVQLLRPILEYP